MIFACLGWGKIAETMNPWAAVLYHLLAGAVILGVWESLRWGARMKEPVQRMKFRICAAIAETLLLANAGEVFRVECQDAVGKTVALGWICAAVVLVDRLIEAHARPDSESDWMLDHMLGLRCTLLGLGVAGHLTEKLTGASYWSVGTALVLILGFSLFACFRRYGYVTGSGKPRKMIESSVGLDVRS